MITTVDNGGKHFTTKTCPCTENVTCKTNTIFIYSTSRASIQRMCWIYTCVIKLHIHIIMLEAYKLSTQSELQLWIIMLTFGNYTELYYLREFIQSKCNDPRNKYKIQSDDVHFVRILDPLWNTQRQLITNIFLPTSASHMIAQQIYKILLPRKFYRFHK